MVHPLRALRRWLNVKTWDQTHVPLELDPEEEKLRKALDGLVTQGLFPDEKEAVAEAIKEEYIELDRKIRASEISTLEAMTQFWSGGDIAVKGKVIPKKPLIAYTLPELDDDGNYKLGRLKSKLSTEKASEWRRVKWEGPTEYIFEPLTEEFKNKYDHKVVPVRVLPKSGIYRPPNLSPDEWAAIKLVQDFTSAAKHLTGLTIKPKIKPALQKKKEDYDKGWRRVTIDENGKIHEVKEASLEA